MFYHKEMIKFEKRHGLLDITQGIHVLKHYVVLYKHVNVSNFMVG